MKTIHTFIGAALLLLAHTASAQATRTWVSGVGDDANPCSRTAPGKTFAGAISKTAAGGVIDVLDPGGFGAVTITKSITIDGGSNLAGVLVAGTNGIVINAAATDVVILRNLQFEGVGSGLSAIKILCAGAVYIENCHINGFQKGIEEVTTASGGTQVIIRNSQVRECSISGISLTPGAAVASSALIEKTSVENCGTGVTAAPRGTATLSDSTIIFNTGAGIAHTGNGVVRSFRNNQIFGNNPDGTPGTIFQK